MHHRFYLALLAACCLTAMICSTARADEYRLGPGDIMVVTVMDHPTFGGTATVTMDGMVQLPIVNQVSVNGLTLNEATARLITAYKRRLVNPEVYVTLSAPQQARAYIVGAVAKPGIYSLNKNLTSVLDLLMEAGGLTHPFNTATATLTRKAGEKTSLRLGDVLAGDRQANLALSDGDLLSIDMQPTVTIFITGEVETPGLYELPAGVTVSKALAAAHGVKGGDADLAAVILRDKGLLPVDLSTLYQPQHADADIELKQGDVLRVDTAKISVEVAGDVRTPAVYTPTRGTELSDVLNLAGGTNSTARLSAVMLTHHDGTQEAVDLSLPLTERKRIVVTNGDKIFIPSTAISVSITGEVKVPNTYQLSPQLTLQDAVTIAGGPTANALLSTVAVHHPGGTTETFDLASGQTYKVAWQAGDRIILSSMTTRVAVIGNVATPGYLPFDAAHPYTASEAVIRAGGPKPKSALTQARVLRMKDGKPQQIAFNLDAVMRKLDTKKDVLLQPGDMIYLPASSSVGLSDIVSTLMAIRLFDQSF